MKKFIFALMAVLAVAWVGSAVAQQSAFTTPYGVSQPCGDIYGASWLIGHRVFSPSAAGHDIGQISRLIVDTSTGRVAFVVISDVPGWSGGPGGYPGNVVDDVAVPFSLLVRTGENTFTVALGDRFLGLPPNQYIDPVAYALVRNADVVRVRRNPDAAWATNAYRFYGLTPYWTEDRPLTLMSYGGTYAFEPRIQAADGSVIGNLDDFAINSYDGRIVLAALDTNGRVIAVPAEAIDARGNVLIVNIPPDRFASAPEFRLSDLGSCAMIGNIYTFYGLQPYWTMASAQTTTMQAPATYTAPQPPPVVYGPSQAAPGRIDIRVYPPAGYTVNQPQVMQPSQTQSGYYAQGSTQGSMMQGSQGSMMQGSMAGSGSFFLGRNLIGRDVMSSDGRTIGKIKDFVVDPQDGRIALLVLDNMSGRQGVVAVPFTALSMSGSNCVLNIPQDKLAQAPAFSGQTDRRSIADIYVYFGQQPYWTTGR